MTYFPDHTTLFTSRDSPRSLANKAYRVGGNMFLSSISYLKTEKTTAQLLMLRTRYKLRHARNHRKSAHERQ